MIPTNEDLVTGVIKIKIININIVLSLSKNVVTEDKWERVGNKLHMLFYICFEVHEYKPTLLQFWNQTNLFGGFEFERVETQFWHWQVLLREKVNTTPLYYYKKVKNVVNENWCDLWSVLNK